MRQGKKDGSVTALLRNQHHLFPFEIKHFRQGLRFTAKVSINRTIPFILQHVADVWGGIGSAVYRLALLSC
jgi:hypothetical protein